MIYVSPSFRPLYYFFYVEGVRRLFPGRPISFAREGFPDKTQYDDGCAVYVADAPRPRVYLSANDHARIDDVAHQWCDAYGVVNCPVDRGGAPSEDHIHAIGPSFGVNLEERGQGLRLAAEATASLVGRPAAAFAFAREWKQLRLTRTCESRYTAGEPRAGYVFHLSWPWRKHSEVNPPRERFIRACKAVATIDFEGGFAPRRQRDVDGIADISTSRRYPIAEYLLKTARSEFVFNCPAVHGCHGWKLGEYLALGKAIISLPLSRRMPAPLVHGEHVHYVTDEPGAIEEAVRILHADREYRKRLERAARQYYERYLEPRAVMASLLGMGSER